MMVHRHGRVVLAAAMIFSLRRCGGASLSVVECPVSFVSRLKEEPLDWPPDPVVGKMVNGGLLSCSPATPLREAARLMSGARVSCILIVADGEVKGIWSEGDTRRLNFSDSHLLDTPIAQWMTSPVVSVPYSCTINDASSLMKKMRLRRLLVRDAEGQPLGMLTQSDIVRQHGVEHYLLMRSVGTCVAGRPLRLPAALPVDEAVRRLREAGGEAVVVDRADGTPGIMTERDLVGLLANGLPARTLGDVSRQPLVSVNEDTSMLRAVDLLRERGFRHLGVTDASGELCGLLSFSDVLASVEYEYVHQLRKALVARDRALQASSEHLRLAQKVIDASLDGIIITDASGVIQSVNPSFTTLTGYTPEEAVGNTPRMLQSGRHSRDFYQAMWRELLEQGYWQGEVWNRRKNGEIYPEWLSITVIRNDVGEVRQFAAIFSDITNRKRREERIHTLAYFDDLTGLANRRLFLDRLQLAMANAHRHRHRLAVLFLDLDLFKRINDTLGHHAGDQVLREIARRLQQGVREGDSVARLGGDEFTILVPEVGALSGVEQLASRLIDCIGRPIPLLGQEMTVSTSIGISIYPEDGETTEILLKHADTAMYRAKENGRNHYCFYTSLMGEHNHSELALEYGLRRALAQNELTLAYQPKVDMAKGCLVGLEALLRWEDEALGTVSPGQFIPLAEKLGLIERLGDWVLEAVCQQLGQWQGLPRVPVAINVSARQLNEAAFCDNLEVTLARHGIEPCWIELELTESCLIPASADNTLRVLQRLRALGVRLSIDDFGTGYSSLSYLRRLPIDTLKIDASFVRDLPHRREDAQITQAVIAMARALNLEVIAEGIETLDQACFLLQHGCAVGQGFWLARPGTPVQAATWLSRGGDGHVWPGLEALQNEAGV